MMAAVYAPPSPEPTPSDELSTPSPTVTVTTTQSPVEKLPVTGPSDTAVGAFGLGLVVLLAGVTALVALRVRRTRTG